MGGEVDEDYHNPFKDLTCQPSSSNRVYKSTVCGLVKYGGIGYCGMRRDDEEVRNS